MVSYLKIASLISFSVFLSYCLLYAEPKKGEVSPPEDVQENTQEEATKSLEDGELPLQPGCACIKSINKLRKVEKAAREHGVSMSKAYRIKKDYILSPETIAEALHCHCARQIINKTVAAAAVAGCSSRTNKKIAIEP